MAGASGTGVPRTGPPVAEGSPITAGTPTGGGGPAEGAPPAQPPLQAPAAGRGRRRSRAGVAPGRRRGWRRALVEWGVVVVVAVVVALLVRAFLLQTFLIPSGSMETTLLPGDRIVVSKVSYDMHPVHRGDIIVFARPHTWPKDYPDLVKRVIALPGETLWAHGGHVYLDTAACRLAGTSCTGPDLSVPGASGGVVTMRQLREPWLPAGDRGVTAPGPSLAPYSLHQPYTVPAGDYFVMGDNRTDSADSRYNGPVPRHDIVGEAVLRYWPLGRIGSL